MALVTEPSILRDCAPYGTGAEKYDRTRAALAEIGWRIFQVNGLHVSARHDDGRVAWPLDHADPRWIALDRADDEPGAGSLVEMDGELYLCRASRRPGNWGIWLAPEWAHLARA